MRVPVTAHDPYGPARMDVESTPERSFVDDAVAYRQDVSGSKP